MAKLLKFESVRDAAKKPAFDQVYEENYDRVYKYTYSILLNREDTEDVVSNTFMAAYAAYDRYDPAKVRAVEEALQKGVKIADTEAYEKYAEEVKNRSFMPDSWE